MARRNKTQSPLSFPALTRSAVLALAAAAAVVAIAFAYPLAPTEMAAVATTDDSAGSARAQQLKPDFKTAPLPLPKASSLTKPPVLNNAKTNTPAAPLDIHTDDTVAKVTDKALKTSSPPVDQPPLKPPSLEKQTIDAAAPELVIKPAAPSLAGWRQTAVESGDTLSSIFNRLAAKPEDLHALYLLIKADKSAKALEKLRPGQTIKVHTDADGALLELIYQPSQLRYLELKRAAKGFSVMQVEHPLETSVTHAAGTVSSSLYGAAKQAGLSDKLIIKLGDIFGWKIDFSHDVAPGDTFIVIYEQKTLKGKKVADGNILAAEYINRRKTYRAIGLAGNNGRMQYYTPDGKSLKQAFMRNPVSFHRISSHFQPNRFHPVLGKRRPHRGVDYAAPTGTPIKTSGDGRVKSIKRGRGYGRVIEIDHGNGYTTLYAHMSRFNKKLRVGSAVSQGDVIGYVGSSGLATGPHLHYEFRINGKHKNPITVKLPGKPINAKLRARLDKAAARYVAELDRHRRTQVAANSD